MELQFFCTLKNVKSEIHYYYFSVKINIYLNLYHEKNFSPFKKQKLECFIP